MSLFVLVSQQIGKMIPAKLMLKVFVSFYNQTIYHCFIDNIGVDCCERSSGKITISGVLLVLITGLSFQPKSSRLWAHESSLYYNSPSGLKALEEWEFR